MCESTKLSFFTSEDIGFSGGTNQGFQRTYFPNTNAYGVTNFNVDTFQNHLYSQVTSRQVQVQGFQKAEQSSFKSLILLFIVGVNHV